MKIPVSWLNEFVDVSDLSVKEIAERLTFSGVEVESIDTVGANLDEHIVVGEVQACEPHPDSDHMHVCKVFDGTEVFQVVCGAPNVRVGIKTPFAKLGAYIPGGDFTIVPRKLRGVESNGMLCAADELSISSDHGGIMELDSSVIPGTPMKELLPPPETVLDLEITWNRPDCLSVLGIAREMAALLGRPLKLPPVDFEESESETAKFVDVKVLDAEKCPRYTARFLENVKPVPSPEWMAKRLEMCSVRSISLPVDVSNYVMLECGQPLHMFDYKMLKSGKIVVRSATPGETIRTLDGVERKLDETMLAICDETSPVAVAGVMGGEGSEIKDNTESVLIESALFNAPNVKFTAQKLGLGTEASYRYIRGVDPELADWASRRVAHLMFKYGGAKVAKGVVDVDCRSAAAAPVTLRCSRARAMIGAEIDDDKMVSILESLGLKTLRREGDEVQFEIPSWRLDLTMEADLVEEIARMYGLDAIPSKLPDASAVSTLDDRPFYRKAKVRSLLLGLGFSEAMHYSFLSRKELDVFDSRDPKRRVEIPNPVSAEYALLRDSLLPQLSQSLGRNSSHQIDRAGLFEIGRIFFADPRGIPHEEERLAIGLMGPFGRPALDRRRAVENEESMLWLKGAVEELAAALHADTLAFTPIEHPAFEKGWAAEIKIGKQKAGIIGLAKKALRHPWRMTQPMALCELRLSVLLKNVDAIDGSIAPSPTFPESTRDVAFVADESLTHERIVEVIRGAGSQFLTEIELFDTFRSKQLGEGRRSVAYSMSFRAPDRTLRDEEVNAAFRAVIEALKSKLGVDIRQ